MSWNTDFKKCENGNRLIVLTFLNFATIHVHPENTILYRNGERIITIDGEIKVSELEALANRVEADFLKLKEFNHESTN